MTMEKHNNSIPANQQEGQAYEDQQTKKNPIVPEETKNNFIGGDINIDGFEEEIKEMDGSVSDNNSNDDSLRED